MKYAIISDIHANALALRNILADAREHGAERVICLGDIVGYGPLPKETLALVRESADVTLAGNHDDAVSGRQSAADFINLAGEAVQRHHDAIAASDLAWLRSLPYECELEGALAAHGDFTAPKKFYYIEDEIDADANFSATDAQLMFVGHTHVPALFVTGRSGNVYRLDAQDFTVEYGKRYIVNPGSVGYPREDNGVCMSSYAIYDSKARSVFFRRLPFAVSSVMQRGTGPKKRKAAIVIAACAIIFASALGAYIMLRPPRTEIKTVTVEVPAREDRSLVMAEKSLTLGQAARFVRANLKLDREFDPVTLNITFKNATGAVCGKSTSTVKASARQRIKIPQGAVSALFTVLKPQTNSLPKILSFAPDLMN